MAATATSQNRPVPIVAAGVSSSSEEAPTTSTTEADEAPTTTVTFVPGDELEPAPGIPDVPDVPDVPDATTTTTLERRREATTPTIEPARDPLELWCGIPERERGVVCEWNDAPDRANRLVLSRHDGER